MMQLIELKMTEDLVHHLIAVHHLMAASAHCLSGHYDSLKEAGWL